MLLKQRLASSCFILSRIPKRKDIRFEKQIKHFFCSRLCHLPYLNRGPVITAVTVIRAEPWI